MDHMYEVVVIERFDDDQELEMGNFELPCPYEGGVIEGADWGEGFRIIGVSQIDHDAQTAEIIGEWV